MNQSRLLTSNPHKNIKIKKQPFLILFITFILLLLSANIQAQSNNIIKGKVIDSHTQAELSYASVEVRSSKRNVLLGGGITDINGEFEIKIKHPEEEYNIVVNFVGYKTEKRHFNPKVQKHYLEISMQEDAMTLNEVVVKGLSPAEKVQRLAYNVSLLETSKLKNTTFDLANAIDKISGVKIRQNGGVGSEANVSLNGFSGRHVKIFIDGVPMDGMR